MAFIESNMRAKSRNGFLENQYDYDPDCVYDKFDELKVIKKETDFESSTDTNTYEQNFENYMLQNFNIEPSISKYTLPSMVPGTKNFVDSTADSFDYMDNFEKHSSFQNLVSDYL